MALCLLASYMWCALATVRDLNVKTIAYIVLFLTIGVASCAAFGVDYDRSQQQETSQ